MAASASDIAVSMPSSRSITAAAVAISSMADPGSNTRPCVMATQRLIAHHFSFVKSMQNEQVTCGSRWESKGVPACLSCAGPTEPGSEYHGTQMIGTASARGN